MNSTSLLSAIGMLAIAAAASTASLAYAGLGLLNEPAMPQAPQPTGRALTAMNTGWVSRDTDRHNGHRRDHERDRPMHPTAAAKLGMQAVPTSTGPGEPAHGWRYYTDAPAGRAVVISPQGEYFLSRGEGLRLVAVTQSVH